jgi:hypothetical protein
VWKRSLGHILSAFQCVAGLPDPSSPDSPIPFILQTLLVMRNEHDIIDGREVEIVRGGVVDMDDW